MDIELRLLRSFAAIYECGTLSRAADRLACTQAAMSMRLKLIETEVGELQGVQSVKADLDTKKVEPIAKPPVPS